MQKRVAVVRVTVKRNANAPSFTRSEYTVKIHEKQPLHDVILQMTATDLDKVSVKLVTIQNLVVVFQVPVSTAV